VTGRGATRAGQPAPVAPAGYHPASDLPSTGSVVHFRGEDGRTKVIDLARWPLPGWHPILAPAIAAWIGPAGGRRTFASAKRVWTTTERFLRYLAEADNPPATPQQATVSHLEAFHEHVRRTGNDYTAWYLIRELRILFCHPSAQGQFSRDVLDWVSQPAKTRIGGVTGYTDGEFTRIVAAARRDTAIACRNVALTAANQEAWRAELERLRARTTTRPALPPLLLQQIRQRIDELTTFIHIQAAS
jgi:hypothetical protein